MFTRLLVSWFALALAGTLAARQSSVFPPPSAGHALVYHGGLKQIVLVNAGLGTGHDDETLAKPARLWGWEGSRWSVLDSNGPPPRNLAGVAYDAARDVLVLHGGLASSSRLFGETWEWNPRGGWRQAAAAGPGIRHHTQMVYDPVRRESVLYGGRDGEGGLPDDVWLWNGKVWRQVRAPGPGGRVHHGMQFDQSSGRIVVAGGIDAHRSRLTDCWAWDGQGWVASPPLSEARSHATLVYVDARERLAIVGGLSASNRLPFLSERTASGWQSVDADGPHHPRFLPGAAYDPGRRVVVVYGGGPPGSHALFDDTWEFDGLRWSRKPPR